MYFGWFGNYDLHLKNGKFQVIEQEKSGETIYEIAEHEDIIRGNLELDLGACEILLDEISNEVINVESSIEKIKTRSEERKDTVDIVISESGTINTRISNNRYVNVGINDEIQWDINANIGAADATFDMRKLNVSEFNLSVGAGHAKVIYGELSKNIYSTIDGGVSNIEIVVPKDSGLKIESDSGLTIVNDEIEFASDSDVYISDNFSKAKNKIYMTLELGLCNVSIDYE